MCNLEFQIHLITHLESLLGQSIVDSSTPPQGMGSHVFFVKTETGKEYAVKYGVDAGKDVPALKLIKDKDLKIPVPNLIAYFEFDSVPVVILEKIDFPLLEKVPVERLSEYIPSMVNCLRSLHELKSPKPGRVAEQNFSISWKSMIKSIFDGSQFDWKEVSERSGVDGILILKSVENILAKIESINLPDNNFSLLHTDFNQRNLFVDLSSNKITGVIDWEDAMYGDPIFDFARVRMFIWHFGLSENVVKDYYDLMDYTSDERAREDFYWLVRVIQYLAWYSEDLNEFSISRIKLHQEFLRDYNWDNF